MAVTERSSLSRITNRISDVLKRTGEVVVNPHGEFDKGVIRAFLGPPNLNILHDPEYQAAYSDLHNAFQQSWRWHGTGRFQYDPLDRSQVRDVLQTVITEKGLIPHTDPLDYTRGVMQSVSTSPAFPYSLLYAQLHYPRGQELLDILHTKRLWKYYLGHIGIEALKDVARGNFTHLKLLSKDFRKQVNLDTEGTKYFHDKYSTQLISNREMFNGGLSDIPANYPVLVGIKNGAFAETNITSILNRHESRAENEPISITDFSHIEVPLSNISAVKKVIDQNDLELPVYPIEWMLEVCKQQPRKAALDGKPTT